MPSFLLFSLPAICLSELLKYYFPFHILFLLFHHCAFLYHPFFLFFSLFFSSLKFPHSYNSTRFSRDRIAAEQDCERINSNFGETPKNSIYIYIKSSEESNQWLTIRKDRFKINLLKPKGLNNNSLSLSFSCNNKEIQIFKRFGKRRKIEEENWIRINLKKYTYTHPFR